MYSPGCRADIDLATAKVADHWNELTRDLIVAKTDDLMFVRTSPIPETSW